LETIAVSLAAFQGREHLPFELGTSTQQPRYSSILQEEVIEDTKGGDCCHSGSAIPRTLARLRLPQGLKLSQFDPTAGAAEAAPLQSSRA